MTADIRTARLVDVLCKGRLGLTLGEVRRFVAEADRLELPDKVLVTTRGHTESAVYMYESHPHQLKARHEN